MHYPDYWVIVRISDKMGDTFLKLFATTIGGWTVGEDWRLNSGIVKVEFTKDNELLVHGNSGSTYSIINKEASYRTTAYTGSVLDSYVSKYPDRFEVLGYKEAVEELEKLK
jgi:hypothetical protein